MSEKVSSGAFVLVSRRPGRSVAAVSVCCRYRDNEYSSNADFFRMEPFYRTRIGNQDRFIPGGYDFGNDAYIRERRGVYVACNGSQPTVFADQPDGLLFEVRREIVLATACFATSQTLGGGSRDQRVRCRRFPASI